VELEAQVAQLVMLQRGTQRPPESEKPVLQFWQEVVLLQIWQLETVPVQAGEQAFPLKVKKGWQAEHAVRLVQVWQ
jgi:hypothetical protein